MPTQLNQHLQDQILLLMITDDGFLKLVAGRMAPRLFLSTLSENLGSICLGYWEQYRRAPADHFHDELVRFLRDRDDAEKDEHAAYVKRLREMPPPHREYVLRRVSDFVGLRAREEAAVAFAQHVARGEIEDADNLMFKTLRAGIPEEDAGLDYLYDLSAVGARLDRPSYLTGTGVPAMDRLIGGLSRGQLVSILGPPKGGKTWAMQWIAREALRCGLRVAHVTHEVPQEELELRYDMMLTGRGKTAAEPIRRMVVEGGEPRWRSIPVRSVLDPAAVRRARRAMRSLAGQLRLKKYPMGQCTPGEVERWLNYLEAYEGFEPDVLINDYVDIMDLGGYDSETRHRINQGYIWSKGLADERDILVVTGSQIRREACDRRHVRQKDVAEDIRKVANVDLMLAIGRSKQDIDWGVAGLSVLANRSGRQDCYCLFAPGFEIGQFCLSSWLPGECNDDNLSQFFGDIGETDGTDQEEND